MESGPPTRTHSETPSAFDRTHSTVAALIRSAQGQADDHAGHPTLPPLRDDLRRGHVPVERQDDDDLPVPARKPIRPLDELHVVVHDQVVTDLRFDVLRHHQAKLPGRQGAQTIW